MKRFLFIFLLLIGAALAIAGVRQVHFARSSSKWPTVRGTIIRSELSASLQPDPHQHRSLIKRYKPEIEYFYDVGETSHRARLIAYGASPSFNQFTAAAVIAKYPTGRLVTVHYKPTNPAIAVLEPGLNRKAVLLPISGVFFFCAGLLGLVTERHRKG